LQHLSNNCKNKKDHRIKEHKKHFKDETHYNYYRKYYFKMPSPLDEKIRGILEGIIDRAIKSIPDQMKLFINRENKARMQIQSENDFVLGMTLGIINQRFLYEFIDLNQRVPDNEEFSQVVDIIFRRTAEMREATFKSG
jgi:hypothetical protein